MVSLTKLGTPPNALDATARASNTVEATPSTSHRPRPPPLNMRFTRHFVIALGSTRGRGSRSKIVGADVIEEVPELFNSVLWASIEENPGCGDDFLGAPNWNGQT